MKSLSLIIWPLELFHQPMSPFNESKFSFTEKKVLKAGRVRVVTPRVYCFWVERGTR